MRKRLGLNHQALCNHVQSIPIKKGEQHRYVRFYAAMVLTDIVREVSPAQQCAEAIWLSTAVRWVSKLFAM